MELAQCLNFTRAAVNLYIAQPALSQQIAELEKQLGVTLFVRNSRSVALTPAGRILMEACPDILGRLEKVHKQLLQAQAGIRGSLRIGYLDTYRNMLPPILKAFSQIYPDVTLELFDGSVKEQKSALAGGQVDVAFTFINPYAMDVNASTACNVLWREDLCLAVQENHPFVAGGCTELAMLADETLLILDDEASPHYPQFIQEACRELELKFARIRTGRSMSSLSMQVAAGLGVALLPQSAANVDAQVRFVPVRKSCMDFGVVWDQSAGNASLPLFLDLVEKMYDTVPSK